MTASHPSTPPDPPAPFGPVLARFPRERGDVLLLTKEEYRGKEFLSLRLWIEKDIGLIPTRRGVSIRVSEVYLLMEALARYLEPDNFED